MLSTMDVLVRRGSEFVQKQMEVKFPTWAAVLLVLLAVVFTVATTMVEYTYSHLIPALIMVESPEATLYDPIATTNEPLMDFDDSKHAPEPELILVKHKPVTSSFRSTLTHLRARAGRRSRVRGFMIYMLSFSIMGYLTGLINLLHFIPFSSIVAPVIASVISAPLFLLWTHIVISEPTATRWYKRFAPFQAWKKIAGPTALATIAKNTAIVVPLRLFMKLNENTPRTPDEWTQLSCHAKSMVMLQGFGVAILSFALWVLLFIPAKVTLTQVQASLLADEEEPIVPFDRTYGGKTQPHGVLGMLDAWKTFDWNSRVRLLKAYVKAAAIQVALVFFFSGLALITAVVAIGPEKLREIVNAINSGIQNINVGNA